MVNKDGYYGVDMVTMSFKVTVNGWTVTLFWLS